MPVVQSQGMFWSLALKQSCDNFSEATSVPVFGRLYYTTERIMQSTGEKAMAGSTFGTIFKVMTWGESRERDRRCDRRLSGRNSAFRGGYSAISGITSQGQNRYTTKRAESDLVEIVSGTFEGKTTGTPISLLVWNQDQRSRDYSTIAQLYRPGHADYTYDAKYGFRDSRGGGRFIRA